MKTLIVDADRCLRDGLCLSVCNKGVLCDNAEGLPVLAEAPEARCNECGHCAAVCPVGAILPPGGAGEAAVPLDPALKVDFAAASQFLLSCRSVRRYKETPVSKEEIIQLLDVARKAPSGSNAQPLRWKIVSGRETMSRISALTVEWYDTCARHDPVLSTRYNPDNIVSRFAGGYDIIMRGAPNAVFAISGPDARWGPEDAAIALTYFCLAANAKNIGSCWCGFAMRAVDAYAPLRELLKLGDEDVVRGIAFFGYPAVTFHAVPPRRPLRVEWL